MNTGNERRHVFTVSVACRRVVCSDGARTRGSVPALSRSWGAHRVVLLRSRFDGCSGHWKEGCGDLVTQPKVLFSRDRRVDDRQWALRQDFAERRPIQMLMRQVTIPVENRKQGFEALGCSLRRLCMSDTAGETFLKNRGRRTGQ